MNVRECKMILMQLTVYGGRVNIMLLYHQDSKHSGCHFRQALYHYVIALDHRKPNTTNRNR